MATVFISHSSHDKAFVRRLARGLHSRGVQTWVDERQIKVGQPIPRRLAEGIENADFFLIVVSARAMKSQWVEHELNSAIYRSAQKKPDSVLPLLLDDVELPSSIKHLKYADFRGSLRKGLRDLLDAFAVKDEELPFLSRAERISKIEALLPTVDQHGELPTETLSLVEDDSYIFIFEKQLSLEAPRRLVRNSLYAITFLAEAWDGRCIRRHDTIEPLLKLYEATAKAGDFDLKRQVVKALCAIDSNSTRQFLIGLLLKERPEILSEILSAWQFCDDWDDLHVWAPRMLPPLHQLILRPQTECLYYNDEDGEERDFRFWLFRCLSRIRSKKSRRFIARFLSTVKWPQLALVEAAFAYWRITGSKKYVFVARKAARSKNSLASSRAHDFLKEVRTQSRRKGKKTKKI